MNDRIVTYPADAAQRLADRLCDTDWSLAPEEALETATDVVIDVTEAVDKLRMSEAPANPRLVEILTAINAWENDERYEDERGSSLDCDVDFLEYIAAVVRGSDHA